eukprot:1311939-Amphidinium_carterae.1
MAYSLCVIGVVLAADFQGTRRVLGFGHQAHLALAVGRHLVVRTACGAYSHKRWDKLGRRCQTSPLSVSATRVQQGWHPASGLLHLPLQILGPLEVEPLGGAPAVC